MSLSTTRRNSFTHSCSILVQKKFLKWQKSPPFGPESIHTWEAFFMHVSVEMDLRKLRPLLRPACTIYTESAAALESCRKEAERGLPPHVGK